MYSNRACLALFGSCGYLSNDTAGTGDRAVAACTGMTVGSAVTVTADVPFRISCPRETEGTGDVLYTERPS